MSALPGSNKHEQGGQGSKLQTNNELSKNKKNIDLARVEKIFGKTFDPDGTILLMLVFP